jgi:3D (Asp-Asp-Asp) domain-containing protein
MMSILLSFSASFEYTAVPSGGICAVTPTKLPIKVNAVVTAYCPNSCDDPDCIMANGEKAYYGAVACPRAIPFETKIKVDDYEFVCKDRLARKYDDRFDIFMDDCENARLSGKHNEEILIYERN